MTRADRDFVQKMQRVCEDVRVAGNDQVALKVWQLRGLLKLIPEDRIEENRQQELALEFRDSRIQG